MALITYRNPVNRVPSTFSRMIDEILNDSFDRPANSFKPQVDIIELEKEFEIQLAVPGMKKDDFKIEVNEDNLQISGERKFENESEGRKFHTVETYYGSFTRSFTLPKNVDQDKINASYDDGILVLHLPKTEKSLEKTIKIK